MDETCNWGHLMTLLEEDIEVQKIENQEFIENIRQIMIYKSFNPLILHHWYTSVMKLHSKVIVNFHKRVLKKTELNIRAGEIYKEILYICDSDDELLRIKSLIDTGPKISKKISGRTIDTLVTRFPRYSNVCYYLDVTDKKNTKIVDVPQPNRKVILFDIGSSYRHKMHQYSKTFFDCFGRGDIVEHILGSGTILHISLCQFTFFIWATQFKIFEFMEKEYERIVLVRQYSQKNTYTPKRKRKVITGNNVTKQIRTTVLYPHVVHGREIRMVSEPVIIMKSQSPVKVRKYMFKKRLVPSLNTYNNKENQNLF